MSSRPIAAAVKRTSFVMEQDQPKPTLMSRLPAKLARRSVPPPPPVEQSSSDEIEEDEEVILEIHSGFLSLLWYGIVAYRSRCKTLVQTEPSIRGDSSLVMVTFRDKTRRSPFHTLLNTNLTLAQNTTTALPSANRKLNSSD